MYKQTEAEILMALSQGDVAAFEYIYKRYHTNIFLVAQRYVRSEEDAKDARSKCFIKLWEHRERLHFNSMGALYGWLRSTVTNGSIDFLRSENFRAAKKPGMIQYYNQDHEPEVFEASDKEAVILERIIKEIDLLPPKCKEVFMMRWQRDLKFREIAAELNTDISTIKKRYSRAVELLREHVGFKELWILVIILLEIRKS